MSQSRLTHHTIEVWNKIDLLAPAPRIPSQKCSKTEEQEDADYVRMVAVAKARLEHHVRLGGEGEGPVQVFASVANRIGLKEVLNEIDRKVRGGVPQQTSGSFMSCQFSFSFFSDGITMELAHSTCGTRNARMGLAYPWHKGR